MENSYVIARNYHRKQVCPNAFEFVQKIVCPYNFYTTNMSWSLIIFMLILSIWVFPPTYIEYKCLFWTFCPEKPKFGHFGMFDIMFLFQHSPLLKSSQTFFCRHLFQSRWIFPKTGRTTWLDGSGARNADRKNWRKNWRLSKWVRTTVCKYVRVINV
jgi:hypothetical protein